jgi:hypothetical protein
MSVRHDVTVATVLLAAVGLAGLAACGAGEGSAAPSTTRTVTVTASTAEAPQPSATTSATDPPSASPTASPTESPVQGLVEAEPTGEQVFLVDARVGSHEGYDRVVWELAGDGTPGYRVGWTDDPRRDGSGEVVDLPGDATLQVVLVGVGIPPDAPAGITPYDGPQTLSLDSTAVTEVAVGDIFEGYLTGFVGAEAERPFEVVLLSGPTRVVVDVSH